MTPALNAEEREMLDLIASHYIVPVQLFKPVTDGLEAKRLVVLDQEGVWRITEFGEAVIARTRGRLH